MQELSIQELSWTSRTRIFASSDLWVLQNTSTIQSLLGVHRTIDNRAEWWQVYREMKRSRLQLSREPNSVALSLSSKLKIILQIVISGAIWEKKHSAYYEHYKEQTEENLPGKVQSLKQVTWVLLPPHFPVEVSQNTNISFTCNFKEADIFICAYTQRWIHTQFENAGVIVKGFLEKKKGKLWRGRFVQNTSKAWGNSKLF